MQVSLALEIVTYLVKNRKEIADLILQIQDLFPDTPGEEKASVVRKVIGTVLGISDKIEESWPLVSPIFNLFVAKVKGK